MNESVCASCLKDLEKLQNMPNFYIVVINKKTVGVCKSCYDYLDKLMQDKE